MIEPGHPDLSVVRRCEVLAVGRSGFYDQPAGETAETLALMRLPEARASSEIDAPVLDAPVLDAPW